MGCGYKQLIDMFNSACDPIKSNDHKDKLLENGADININNILDCEEVISLVVQSAS